MEEVLDFREFCEENGLSFRAIESQTRYQVYCNEMEIINRPYLEDVRRRAEEVREESRSNT